MDSGLSPQDKKDLDKFIKFFALKVRFACLSGLLVFQWDEEKNWRPHPIATCRPSR